jgi:predicted PurR-regulated permease PerM
MMLNLSILPGLIRAASASRLAFFAAAFILIMWLAYWWFRKEGFRNRYRVFSMLVLFAFGMSAFVLLLDTGAFSKRQQVPLAPTSSSVVQTNSPVTQQGGVNVNGVSGTVTIDQSQNGGEKKHK